MVDRPPYASRREVCMLMTSWLYLERKVYQSLQLKSHTRCRPLHALHVLYLEAHRPRSSLYSRSHVALLPTHKYHASISDSEHLCSSPHYFLLLTSNPQLWKPAAVLTNHANSHSTPRQLAISIRYQARHRRQQRQRSVAALRGLVCTSQD